MTTCDYMIFALLIAISISITIHEFGHYWVAKQLGVKIPPLWTHRFGTEEPMRIRIPIVLAGPVFNFLLAIFVYTLMFTTGLRPIVGEIIHDSVADRAGLQTGYEIIAVDGKPTPLWDSVGQATLCQLINGTLVTYSVRDQQGYLYDLTLDLSTVSIDEIGQKSFLKILGIELLPAIAGDITPNSAAAQAGLQRGDKIIALDGLPVDNWDTWANYVATHPQQTIKVDVLREGNHFQLSLAPELVKGKGLAGVKPTDAYWQFATERYGLIEAFKLGIIKTGDMSLLILPVLGEMLGLEVSLKNISGPFTIAEITGETAQLGLVAFLSFLGFVSVSLAVLSLLPIPVLDGGYLLLYLIKGIKGGPLTDNAQLLFQRVGVTLFLGLMGLAIFNDIISSF